MREREPGKLLKAFTSLAAAGAILIGTTVLTGWIQRTLPPMSPGSATACLLAGLTLWLLRSEPLSSLQLICVRSLALILVLFGAFTLLAELDVFSEVLLFFGASPGGYRESLPSSINLMAIGVAFLLTSNTSQRLVGAANILTVIVLTTSLLALIGHLCYVPSFYGRNVRLGLPGMSVQAMIAFLCVGVGLLTARPTKGLAQILTSRSMSGTMARRLILAPVLIPLVTGFVQFLTRHHGYFNPEVASWAFAFCNILVFSVAIWLIARLLFRAETELRARTVALQAANEELDAFAGSVAHDLAAPARLAGSYAGFLRESCGESLSSKGKDYLEKVERLTWDMHRLITALLTFCRDGRAEAQMFLVDMAEVVASARVEVEADAGSRTVDWKVNSLPKVHGDPAMLKQVFINLLSNALKYTRQKERAEIEVSCETGSSGELQFLVRDNGAGFDMAYAEKLFVVFQRLHTAWEFEGTGIGLAHVRRIISRHGGRTWAVGEPGKGATFYFTLPGREALNS